jgi:hypothetical protein
MAFIVSGGNVISFAEYLDVIQRDQRLLEANEITLPADAGYNSVPEYVEQMLIDSTSRILLKIKSTTWWQAYNNYVGKPITNLNSVPNVNPSLIDPGNKLGRRPQFTDMTVYYCLKEYLIPLLAQFDVDSADIAKINYYDQKFNDLFTELTQMADWYDADNSGTVDAAERAYSYQSTRRTRRTARIVQVR